MSGHPGIAQLATHTGDPLGVDARHILDDLAAKDRLIGWLLALCAWQDQRRTRGGIPRPFTESWRNTALPVTVHADYRRL